MSHQHMHTYTYMQPHTQPYTRLVKNCGTKLTFYLEAIITRHTVTYMITDAYKLHTIHKTCQKLRHKADFLLGGNYHSAYSYLHDNWRIQVAYNISCTEQYLYWICTYNSQLMLHTASVDNTCNQIMIVLCHRISPRPVLAVNLLWQSVNAWCWQQQQNQVK